MMAGNVERNGEGAGRWLQWIVPALVIACLIYLARSQYFIKAYSDPLNWLSFAENFTKEFGQSKWPFGFPLFLSLALKVTGPFYIFLVNFPVLIALYLMVSAATRVSVRHVLSVAETRWAGLYAFLLIATFDTERFTYYVNPYRDVLAHVILLASVICFICGLERAGSPLRVIASGVLLGLAYSVRETSIFMAGPMAIYGLAMWRSSGWRRNIISLAAWWVVGLLIGLAPFFLQTFLSTRQIFLPPQSVQQGTLVPGMNTPKWYVVESVLAQFWHNMIEDGPWLFLPALLGLPLAFRRGNARVSLIFGLGMAGYFVFYSFYYVFVRRYFLVVMVLSAIPAAYAFTLAISSIAAALRRRNIPSRHAHAFVIVIMTALACGHIVRTGDDSPKFQVDDAKRLTIDVMGAVGDTNAVVYCRRNLCEVLRYFTRLTSYSVPLEQGEYVTTAARILDETRRFMEEGRPVYGIEPCDDVAREHDLRLLGRLFDLQYKQTFQTADYNAGAIVPTPLFRLYRVLPWSNTTASVEITLPVSMRRAVLIGAGLPYEVDPGRKGIELKIGDMEISKLGWRYAEYVALPGSDHEEVVEVALRSDRVLPRAPLVRAMGARDPIDLSFDLQAYPGALGRLSGNIQRPDRGLPHPRIFTEARVEMPEPVVREDQWTAELLLQSSPSQNKNVEHGVDFLMNGQLLASASLPKDKKVRSVFVRLPDGGDRTALVIQRHGDARDATTNSLHQSQWWRADGIDLIRMTLWRRSYSQSVSCTIGLPEDAAVIAAGFHDRERLDRTHPARWTTPRAEFNLDVPQGGVAMRLTLTLSDKLRLPAAPESDVHFLFNGKTIQPAKRIGDPKVPSLEQLVFDISAEDVREHNSFVLECVPWVPAQYRDTRDDRLLGVMVHRIEFAPQ